jgi:hypothetical protein
MFYVYVLAYIYAYFLSRVKPVIYRTLSLESPEQNFGLSFAGYPYNKPSSTPCDFSYTF